MTNNTMNSEFPWGLFTPPGPITSSTVAKLQIDHIDSLRGMGLYLDEHPDERNDLPSLLLSAIDLQRLVDDAPKTPRSPIDANRWLEEALAIDAKLDAESKQEPVDDDPALRSSAVDGDDHLMSGMDESPPQLKREPTEDRALSGLQDSAPEVYRSIFGPFRDPFLPETPKLKHATGVAYDDHPMADVQKPTFELAERKNNLPPSFQDMVQMLHQDKLMVERHRVTPPLTRLQNAFLNNIRVAPVTPQEQVIIPERQNTGRFQNEASIHRRAHSSVTDESSSTLDNDGSGRPDILSAADGSQVSETTFFTTHFTDAAYVFNQVINSARISEAQNAQLSHVLISNPPTGPAIPTCPVTPVFTTIPTGPVTLGFTGTPSRTATPSDTAMLSTTPSLTATPSHAVIPNLTTTPNVPAPTTSYTPYLPPPRSSFKAHRTWDSATFHYRLLYVLARRVTVDKRMHWAQAMELFKEVCPADELAGVKDSAFSCRGRDMVRRWGDVGGEVVRAYFETMRAKGGEEVRAWEEVLFAGQMGESE
ncbi:hypothetical protein M501DRAFT_66965 [Patellaria atrata CBS 101060]|uniref:Uncharacterized protein n=1 Tax=Patellaria atrata CBS 101060 TaxID=1346257 RepID=A0A9P4SJ25_9PEZI|nr:hypothetical protein M501DRAFT_66965 [Patellaria atrata CBS 101060]